ncbi:MAG TPA: hypothetical protein VMV21_04045 [Vicinamibacteria bacterium]|nr:hypothetical protein [Vicinamibacteria bacterium]
MDRFVPEGPGQALRGAFWTVARALFARWPARGGPRPWPWLNRMAGAAGQAAQRLGLHGPSEGELRELFPEAEPASLRRVATQVTALEFRNRLLLETVRRRGLEALAPLAAPADSWRSLAPPAVLVSFHLGALYALPAALRALRAPALVIREGPFYEPPPGHAVAFTRGGVEKRAAVLADAVRQLRTSGFVILAIDRPGGAPTEPVSCLGRLVRFRRGAFALSRLTGAPVVPVTARWESSRGIRIEAHAALASPEAAAEQALAFENELARNAAAWLDAYVRGSADQLWLGSLFDLLDAPRARDLP